MPSIPFMNQFDLAYNAGGFWWMVLYYPVIFGNFLLCMKLFEYGISKGWGKDLTTLIVITAMFIPCLIIYPSLWILNTQVVVN